MLIALKSFIIKRNCLIEGTRELLLQRFPFKKLSQGQEMAYLFGRTQAGFGHRKRSRSKNSRGEYEARTFSAAKIVSTTQRAGLNNLCRTEGSGFILTTTIF